MVKLLIPDGESNYTQPVLQCLGGIRNLQIYIISSRGFSPMRHSRYVYRYIHRDASDEPEDWLQYLVTFLREHPIDVILPMDEARIRQLVAAGQNFPGRKKLLIPHSSEIFDTAKDKARLAELLEQHGIPGPKSWKLDKHAYLAGQYRRLSYPLLLKPTLDTGNGKGIQKIHTHEELGSHFTRIQEEEALFLQEYVEGYDMGCNVLCKDGKILAYTIQQGFLYDSADFTPQVGLNFIKEQIALDHVSRLMEALHWNGIANVDLRYNKKDGSILILEVNPRFWLTMLGSHLAGVNFPWLYCRSVMGDTFDLPEYRLVPFLHQKGLYLTLLKKPLTIFRFRFLCRNTPFGLMCRDPLMTASHLAWRTKRVILKRLGRKQPPDLQLT